MYPNTNSAKEKLKALVERVERLEEEKRTIAEDIKGVFSEAKAIGFDTKAMKKIIAERRMDPTEREELEATCDLYRHALGMDDAPLGSAARKRMTSPPDTEKSTSEDDAPDAPPSERPVMPPVDAAAIEAAREEGATAARAGKTIYSNPYLSGDPRCGAWDAGWCDASGSDGMDIPPAWRRSPKKKGR